MLPLCLGSVVARQLWKGGGSWYGFPLRPNMKATRRRGKLLDEETMNQGFPFRVASSRPQALKLKPDTLASLNPKP